MTSEAKQVLSSSVTADNFNKVKNGVVFYGLMGNGLIMPASALPVQPPGWWSFERDDILRLTLHFESMWSNAIYTAITKISSLQVQFRGPVPLQVKRAQELIRYADPGFGNRSKSAFLQKHLRDFLLTDNGAFFEIIRATRAAGSKILGIKHLDSRRCRRTGDPDVPIIYRDRQNNWHEMKAHQVICLSDMPDPSEMYYGVGYCAGSRAYRKVYEMSALETYVSEKVVGRRPLAIHFVNGVTNEQIRDSIATAESMATSQGYSTFMGSAIVANVDPSIAAQVATIDLAGLPDKFDPQLERRNAYLVYADAIGIDPQELDPELVASSSMGTGAQAKVIDDKASGKGLSAWKEEFMFALNEFVLPDTVYTCFKEKDLRDLTAEAQLASLRTQAISTMITSQIITAEQGRQMLVDAGDIPAEFMTVDLTTTLTLMDDDKPNSVGQPNPDMKTPEDQQAEQQAQQEAQAQQQMEQQQQMQEQAIAAQPVPKKAPEGLQGGNPAMQRARKDSSLKEYDDLRLEQAFSEVVAEKLEITNKETDVNTQVVVDAINELKTAIQNQPRPIIKVLPPKVNVAPPIVNVEVPKRSKHIIRDTLGRITDIQEE